MKCSKCNAEAVVIDTLTNPEFYITRRHKCTNGHWFRSVQVLLAAAKGYRLMERAISHNRTVARQRKRHEVAAALQRGDKWSVIQLELGVSKTLIASVAKELKEGKFSVPGS